MILDPFVTVTEYRNIKTYLTKFLSREIPLCLNESNSVALADLLEREQQLLVILMSDILY